MANKIGIGVFAYNRPSHLKRVLFSLNYLKIKDFTLFVDGPKNSIDRVNNKTINFIAKEMNKSGSRIIIKNHSTNNGLKKSIITGCDYLSKNYDSKTVVHDISISLQENSVIGLLGPNGAGKTTTFYMIVGLIKSNSGIIKIDDHDITSLPMHMRSDLGISYLPQEASIFRNLSVKDNILAILETRKNLTPKKLNDK